MPIKLSGNVSTSNYLAFDGSNENLTMVGVSTKVGSNTTFSLGLGNDSNINGSKISNKPALEAKVKYNIGEHLNAQARFREIGGTEQYRVTFGGSYKLDDKNSLYGAFHATSKNNNGDWNHKAGGWVGVTHNFGNGLTVSGEIQQNIPLNKTAQGVGNTLSSFNDSNKSFNVIVSYNF